MRNRLRKLMSVLLVTFMFLSVLPAFADQATENAADIANGAVIENDFPDFDEWLESRNDEPEVTVDPGDIA